MDLSVQQCASCICAQFQFHLSWAWTFARDLCSYPAVACRNAKRISINKSGWEKSIAFPSAGYLRFSFSRLPRNKTVYSSPNSYFPACLPTCGQAHFEQTAPRCGRRRAVCLSARRQIKSGRICFRGCLLRFRRRRGL